jgi:dCTP diphosphatase
MRSNQPDSIHDLQQKILQFAQDRDWLQFHTPKNLSMAIAKEASELMEHFLWDETGVNLKPAQKKLVEAELSDVLILCFQMATVMNIDIHHAVEQKLATNHQKYPVHKARGNAKKYTDL